MLTKQEIFDRVSTHLLSQNQKSLLDPGLQELPGCQVDGHAPRCAYRGENNTMCAAGCLIRDEFYSPKLENLVADTILVSGALIKSGVDMHDPDISALVSRLQNIHDDIKVEDWPEYLNIAKSELS